MSDQRLFLLPNEETLENVSVETFETRFRQTLDGNRVSAGFPNPMQQTTKYLLMLLALGIPAIKLFYALAVLSEIVEKDTIGYELTHPRHDGYWPRGEIVFLQSLFCLPLTIVTLALGIMTFSKYPKISQTTITEFITFYTIMFAIQIFTNVIAITKVNLHFEEVLGVVLMTASEAVGIILIKVFLREQPRDNGSEGLEMQPMLSPPSNGIATSAVERNGGITVISA